MTLSEIQDRNMYLEKKFADLQTELQARINNCNTILTYKPDDWQYLNELKIYEQLKNML